MPNSYCGDPWGRSFINIEIDTFRSYPREYLVLMNSYVSLLHYEKEAYRIKTIQPHLLA